MKKKLVFWAPFRGRIGTIEAVIQYCNVLSRDYEITLVQLSDEWEPWRSRLSGATLESLWTSKLLAWVGKSNLLRRRDYYLLGVVSIFKLKATLKVLDPDLAIGFLQLGVLAAAAKDLRCRVIGSLQGTPSFFRDGETQGIWNAFEGQLRRRLWERQLPALDIVFCMTSSTRQRMMRDFPGGNYVFAPNALFDRPPSGAMKPEQTPTDLVFVGRLEHQKHPEKFLKIFYELRQRGVVKRAHIFGAGSLYDQLVELRIDGAIFYGHVSDPWREIKKISVVHLVTSRWEDPGHAILEGIYHGVPTIILNSDADYLGHYKAFEPALIIQEADIESKIKVGFHGLKELAGQAFDLHSTDRVSRLLKDYLAHSSS